MGVEASQDLRHQCIKCQSLSHSFESQVRKEGPNGIIDEVDAYLLPDQLSRRAAKLLRLVDNNLASRTSRSKALKRIFRKALQTLRSLPAVLNIALASAARLSGYSELTMRLQSILVKNKQDSLAQAGRFRLLLTCQIDCFMSSSGISKLPFSRASTCRWAEHQLTDSAAELTWPAALQRLAAG